MLSHKRCPKKYQSDFGLAKCDKILTLAGLLPKFGSTVLDFQSIIPQWHVYHWHYQVLVCQALSIVWLRSNFLVMPVPVSAEIWFGYLVAV